MPKTAKIRAVNIVASGSLRHHDATISDHLTLLFPKFMEAQTKQIEYLKRRKDIPNIFDAASDWDYNRKDPDLMLFNYKETLRVNEALYALTIVRRPVILVDVPKKDGPSNATWDYSIVHRKLFCKGLSGMITICISKDGEIHNPEELKLIKLRHGSDKKLPSGLKLAEQEKLIYT